MFALTHLARAFLAFALTAALGAASTSLAQTTSAALAAVPALPGSASTPAGC